MFKRVLAGVGLVALLLALPGPAEARKVFTVLVASIVNTLDIRRW